MSYPLCTRHYFHMVWECTLIKTNWPAMFSELSEVTGLELECTPRLALLGILDDCGGGRGDHSLIVIGTALAKRAIARAWLARAPPVLTSWRMAMD